ncbi:aminodeoxychorismate synthase component I [bacterium]|nr:aminodeoxychorismate synthase component I [bacterium]
MDLGFPASCTCVAVEAVGAAAPIWRLPTAMPPGAPVFLLDSALSDGRLGRWSFAGGEPVALLAGWRREPSGSGLDLELTIWREPDGARATPPRRRRWLGDPYLALRSLRDAYAPDPPAPRHECPFGGGLVGWFGYGVAWAHERLPRRDAGAADRGPVPDLLVMVCDDVVRHEHATGRTTLALTGRGPDTAAAARDLDHRRHEWRERLARMRPEADAGAAGVRAATAESRPAAPGAEPDLSGLATVCDEAAYLAAVARCREHIRAGDAFEICLTRQLSAPLAADPWDLYAALRAINPAPFAAYLRWGDVCVAGASPERFLRCTADGRLESRPIKGTRPRGATPRADEALRSELAGAVKDNAENTMIVDLVRSDLGRVARIGSVAVPELRVVESYATVHQLVSTVTARLKPGCDALDAVRACFPGGSMTGAPKLEAMAIIEALEPAPRGVYAGALGWLGWDGALDLSIVIRTFVCAGGQVSFGTGGAVTADSDPGAEYRESLDKARALVAALRAAGAIGVPGAAGSSAGRKPA